MNENKEYVNCPFCESNDYKNYYSHNQWSVVKCKKCKHCKKNKKKTKGKKKQTLLRIYIIKLIMKLKVDLMGIPILQRVIIHI